MFYSYALFTNVYTVEHKGQHDLPVPVGNCEASTLTLLGVLVAWFLMASSSLYIVC